ncbi:MAG: HAMP domain-containing sensor histidine kinase [Nocardioidaceae bacterium]
MSMAARISLLAACAVGFAVAISSLAAYVTLRTQLHDRLDASLLERASKASETDIVKEATVRNISSDLLGAADLRIFLVYADGAVYPDATWIGPTTSEERAVADDSLNHTLRTVNRAGIEYRTATVQAGSGSALMFVQSAEPIEQTLDRMALVLLLVGGGGIAAAALIGLAVGRSALMPVRRLSAAAEHIARTEELAPIQVTGDDELASLATSFNKMLLALRASRDLQRRLVADAGHELRTPLTSLRTNLELLAQADRQGGMQPHQRDEILSDVTSQVEELSTLVGDLVELARDEPLSRTPEPLDLADIVARAVDRVRRRAPAATFDMDTEPWWVLGEAQILERAVTNLLDNAAKWGPAGGTVTVRLREGQLTVADQGPGVKPADLPMVFERFYRADDARTMPGSGLGLAIVRQAAERHGGTVAIANREPHGAEFTVSIPGSTDDRQAARGPMRTRRPVSDSV